MLGYSGRPHVGTANLLPQETFTLPLRQRRALDRPRLFDKRRIKPRWNSRDDSMVIARELGCGHRNRRSPPYVIASVTQEPSQFGLSGWCVECRSAMACADGREPGESRRHRGSPTRLLRYQDLIEESNFWVACRVSFPLMDEFVEDFEKLAMFIFATNLCFNLLPCVSLIMTAYSC